MNNPINRTDENGNWSVLATVGVVVGASLCIAAATVLTGGVALGPVMGVIATGAAKGALIGAAAGTVAGAGFGYAKTGTLEGAANGVAIGFGVGAVAGAIIGGTSSGLKYAKTNGVKIKEVGRLKPSGKSGNGNLGIKYEIKKANGKIATRSLELHTNHAHKGHKIHWQRNTWNTYNNSISSKKSIHWTWWGKRIK